MLQPCVTRLLNIDRAEALPVIAGFLMQFTLFVCYRGADAVSGWIKAAADLLLTPQMGAIASAGVALARVFSGIYTLGQQRQEKTAAPTAPSPIKEATAAAEHPAPEFIPVLR